MAEVERGAMRRLIPVVAVIANNATHRIFQAYNMLYTHVDLLVLVCSQIRTLHLYSLIIRNLQSGI